MGADPRFFDRLGPFTAGGLADELGLSCFGERSSVVEDAVEPHALGPNQICFLSKGPGDAGFDANGGVVILPDTQDVTAVSQASSVLVAANPKSAFARIVGRLTCLRTHEGPQAIHPTAKIDKSARIAPGAIVAQDAVIGANVVVGPGAVIGPGVQIGEGSRIGARATVQCAILGARCEIYAGAIIGEAGFGLVPDETGLIAIPHIGRAILEDDVTVGANSTIDRGMIRDTVLRRSVKIDNLCHVAHNCEIGEYTVMAAFSGVSGSVEVGKGVQFGGRAGVADHLHIGSGARLAAFAGVMDDVPDGEMWAGSPAQPIRRFLREVAWLRKSAGRPKRKVSEKPGKREA